MRRRSWATLGRHQIAAFLAASLDYLVMIALVSGAGAAPALATACSAAVGAVLNFILGRFWAFDGRDANAGPQVLRYGVVSGTSLGLNTLGEYLVAQRLGVQYVLARVLVSVTISLLWNYPMQRFFVFERRARPCT